MLGLTRPREVGNVCFVPGREAKSLMGYLLPSFGKASIQTKQTNKKYSFENHFSSYRGDCPDIFSIQCTCIKFVWRYQLDFLFFKDVMTFLYSFELSFMYVCVARARLKNRKCFLFKWYNRIPPHMGICILDSIL